jgi:hypothetical protein
MKQLQERPLREIAEAMSISVAAAKDRLFHAKLALRRSSILKHMLRPHRGGGKFRVASVARCPFANIRNAHENARFA